MTKEHMRKAAQTIGLDLIEIQKNNIIEEKSLIIDDSFGDINMEAAYTIGLVIPDEWDTIEFINENMIVTKIKSAL